MMGVPPSVLRYWEKSFDHLNPGKNNTGSRRYTAKDIELLKEIYLLVKVQGHTLNGARKAIENKKEETTAHAILKKLNRMRSKLIKLRQEFDQ